MAVYVNEKAAKEGMHGLFESSKLIATDVGRLHDVLVRDEDGNEIDVDNGVALKMGEYTGNGLQERYGTIAGTKDRIAVTGAPAVVKSAMTKGQGAEYNYYNKAGFDVKTYEVRAEDEDIFAVADYQFTDASADNVAEGNYVVVDGEGAWVAMDSEPSADEYGFIGKIHSLSMDNVGLVTIVRIVAVQNKQLED